MAFSAFAIVGSDVVWTNVVANTSMTNNTGYITNSGGTLNMTLPTTASVGAKIRITNPTGDYSILQNAGQSIIFNTDTTTVGVGGSITTTDVGQSIEMVCIVTDTTWEVLSSTGTTFTVV